MRYILAFITLLVLYSPRTVESTSVVRRISEDYTLLKMVDQSDLAFVGTVVAKTGVLRYNMRSNRPRMITSDIMVRVETMIKGEPNHGNNHVKFMIEGGTVYVPEEDEVMTLTIYNNLNFEVGDRAVIFLSKHNSRWYANYPYDRLHIFYDYYGKRPVKDGEVIMLYKKNNSKLTHVPLPLDLASVLGQAFMVDEDAAKTLEDQIKAFARTQEQGDKLTEATVEQIKTDAQQIIDDAKEDE